jgi:hypothetical protein
MATPRICSVESCGNYVAVRGLCTAHYQRLRAHGDVQSHIPVIKKPRQYAVTCKIEGCGKRSHIEGYCDAHGRRLKAHGDPLGGRKTPWPREEPYRFFEETVLTYDGDDCLIWPYTRLIDGRGQLGRNLVHRRVCEIVNGPPPTERHQAAHNCGKGHEGCVTKRHLQWKTPSENMADKIVHGTAQRGERNAVSKLKESDVLAIRAMPSDIPHTEIAKAFGVSASLVGLVRKRKAWAWLE